MAPTSKNLESRNSCALVVYGGWERLTDGLISDSVVAIMLELLPQSGRIKRRETLL